MDKNTKYIVASNLTAAYFAGMEPYLRNPNDKPEVDPDRRQQQMEQPFNEVIAVYRGFLSSLDERYPESVSTEDSFNKA
jgi:hypothetical protein